MREGVPPLALRLLRGQFNRTGPSESGKEGTVGYCTSVLLAQYIADSHLSAIGRQSPRLPNNFPCPLMIPAIGSGREDFFILSKKMVLVAYPNHLFEQVCPEYGLNEA